MASKSPRVSVGMPVYNAERYIHEALDSILAQTFADFELIISDNASTDDTATICRRYAERDPRIRYYRNETNVGATGNFNRVFELSSGEYFRWAAHDDVLASDCLEVCVSALDRAPHSVVFCFPRTTLIDSEGRFLKRLHHLSKRRLTGEFEGIHELRFSDVMRMTSGRAPQALWGLARADALKKTRLLGAYDSADLVLVAELSLVGALWHLPEYSFFMRLYGQQDQLKARSARQVALWYDTSNTSRFVGPKSAKVCFEVFRAILRSDQSLLNKGHRCIEMRAFFGVRLRKRYERLGAKMRASLTKQAVAASRYTYLPLRFWALARFRKANSGSTLREGVRFVWSIPGEELQESIEQLKPR